MGRQTLLNEDIISKVGEYKASGMSNTGVSDFLGISSRAYYNWINKGEADEENGEYTIYVQFIHTLKKANETFKQSRLQNIVKAADSDNWQAAAWILERKFPEEFGRDRVKNEIDRDRLEMDKKRYEKTDGLTREMLIEWAESVNAPMRNPAPTRNIEDFID